MNDRDSIVDQFKWAAYDAARRQLLLLRMSCAAVTVLSRNQLIQELQHWKPMGRLNTFLRDDALIECRIERQTI